MHWQHKTKDGPCEAWARLFIDVLKIHGIVGTYAQFAHVDFRNETAPKSFMIKNWTFGPVKSRPLSTLPYQNIQAIAGAENEFFNNQYSWKRADVSDGGGIPGQGPIINPKSGFDNHKIVKIGNSSPLYYDPSYGITYESPADFKTKAVAGIFVPSMVSESDLNMDLNDDGVLSASRVETAWYIREPDAGDEFKVDTE